MKTFTAKQFSRAPAQVFESAREDGQVEITHDRFAGKFIVSFAIGPEYIRVRDALNEHYRFTYINPIDDTLKPFFDQRTDKLTKSFDDLLNRHTNERGIIDIDAALKESREEKGPEGPDSE